MKKLFYMLSAAMLVAAIITSCADSGNDRKILQARIDSLTQINAELSAMSNGKLKVEIPRTEPLSPATAASYAASFRSTGVSDIRIPASFTFDADDLVFLANASGNSTSMGSIRFYCGLKNVSGQYEMTLLAVPTDNTGDGNDVFTNMSGQNTVYDFAAPCPTRCDNNNSVLSVAPATCKYHKFHRTL